MNVLKGHCQCGAVTVEAQSAGPGLTACHCDMCRRLSSGAFISFEVDPASAKIEGPVRLRQTSEWAERGFCTECGTPVLYRAGSLLKLSAGLFEDTGLTLETEFFSDKKPSGYAYAGTHARMTEAQVMAAFFPTDTGENT